ncbi:M23 family metallopeptidase [Cognatilysobacter bugurensis]|uniref:M23 family metallopeptidase n=1 Tax=Cognatilysobacter bugurensis TaxID=543356 RepID=UPI003CCD7D16
MRGVLLFLAGLLLGANLLYFWMTRGGGRPEPDAPPVAAATPPAADVPGPVPPPPLAPTDVPVLPRAETAAAPGSLMVPVQGVTPDQLSDTFGDSRGTDRVHEALDILAPAGTPVVAVADGPVAKLFDSKAGGLTIYQFDPTGTYSYYYAHLQSYAPGLEEGQVLQRGQVIGYVGSTGNADPTAPHLHFAVFELGPEKQWHDGTPVNPYPLMQ